MEQYSKNCKRETSESAFIGIRYVIDNLQTKIQNKYGNDIEPSFKSLEEKHQDYKISLLVKGIESGKV